MPASQPDLGDVLRGLAGDAATDDLLDTLNGLVQTSTAYTSASEGGIVLVDADGGLYVMASTSERTTDVEEAQLGTREGPCIDCVATGEALEVADLAEKRAEWPTFTRVAEERGFRAVLATPMRLRGRTLGTVCLFSKEPGHLSDRDAALVQTLADAAILSILQQQEIAEGRALNEQLQHALDSRVVIEQAKGFLAQRLGVSMDEAFTVLRRQARTTQRRLQDVARQVIETGAQ